MKISDGANAFQLPSSFFFRSTEFRPIEFLLAVSRVLIAQVHPNQ